MCHFDSMRTSLKRRKVGTGHGRQRHDDLSPRSTSDRRRALPRSLHSSGDRSGFGRSRRRADFKMATISRHLALESSRDNHNSIVVIKQSVDNAKRGDVSRLGVEIEADQIGHLGRMSGVMSAGVV